MTRLQLVAGVCYRRVEVAGSCILGVVVNCKLEEVEENCKLEEVENCRLEVVIRKLEEGENCILVEMGRHVQLVGVEMNMCIQLVGVVEMSNQLVGVMMDR